MAHSIVDTPKVIEQPSKSSSEPATKVGNKKEQVQPKVSPETAKPAASMDPKEFEGMEDWEVELRKAATEDM